ncbi:FAD-dependent oxidoreductase [Haloprofundus salilacus]|uniref:FAD-dependent oxidoreductase n=1 Tax=Haloprofundus salilacus TaxID=2876190 RepID=UPI001CCE00AC|nr:FAD-dependent oxidoreductase [Haloprofundus salilacus]
MQRYDVVVTGATPAGIGAAVHAARSDLDTLLIAYNNHLGGMMASGLGMTDTLLHPSKGRSPVLDEFFERVATHYREEYGPDSAQYRTCNDGLVFEPHVAEGAFDALVDAEETLDIDREWHPVAAGRSERTVSDVTFVASHDDQMMTVSAETFVDATYEGDLAATAGVPYRVGREAREEYGERFAGTVFTNADDVTTIGAGSTGEGDDAVQSYNYRICLSSDPDNMCHPEKPDGYDRREYLWVLHDLKQMRDLLNERGIEDPMAFGLSNRSAPELATAMRRWYDRDEPPVAVDDDDRWVPLAHDVYRGSDPVEDELLPLPAQTRLLDRTPEGLAGDIYLEQEGEEFVWGNLPNNKRDMNACDLVGESHAYPEADWETRREIAQQHLNYAIGFIYFLQNDDAVPERAQREARQWGLATDEFEDNDNKPFQLYVREARRIEGRETFTEHDAFLAEQLDRAPVNDGSVAIAEFPLDPHDVKAVRRTGTASDGRFFLTESTVPSQIDYGTLLPEGLDNLLVPVALSASHVGFQTVRLEPTWFQLGEAAGVAAARALRTDTLPGTLDPVDLQCELAEAGTMLTYFADADSTADEPWAAAVQVLGAKGFFDGYAARPDDPIDAATADVWAAATNDLVSGDGDATERARQLPTPEERSVAEPVSSENFLAALAAELEADIDPAAAASEVGVPDEVTLSRGEAARIVYELVAGNRGIDI